MSIQEEPRGGSLQAKKRVVPLSEERQNSSKKTKFAELLSKGENKVLTYSWDWPITRSDGDVQTDTMVPLLKSALGAGNTLCGN